MRIVWAAAIVAVGCGGAKTSPDQPAQSRPAPAAAKREPAPPPPPAQPPLTDAVKTVEGQAPAGQQPQTDQGRAPLDMHILAMVEERDLFTIVTRDDLTATIKAHTKAGKAIYAIPFTAGASPAPGVKTLRAVADVKYGYKIVLEVRGAGEFYVVQHPVK
jgi:hypothetical protein